MRILAIRHAVPGRRVLNAEVIERVTGRLPNDTPSNEVVALRKGIERYLDRCGAVARWHRASGERAIDVGVAAGREALTAAGLAARDIDALIYVGVARGFVEPATANVFQSVLGLSNATCFDILDACASWIRAVDVARHMLRGGPYRRVMVMNCECNFEEFVRHDLRGVADLDDLGAGLTIGEAATATILESTDGRDDCHVSFRTCGAHYGLCQIPLRHAAQFYENGNRVRHPPATFYAYATELNRAAIDQLVTHYGDDSRLRGFRPDVVFGHSPSVPAVRLALKRLDVDPTMFVNPFPQYGNTVSASVPLAMSNAIQDGRLQRGQQVLIIVASAGISTAFARFTY